MRIETERLVLYPIGDEEMKDLIERENDPEMKQAYGEMLAGCIADPKMRRWYAVWRMESKENPGTFVGDFCFKGIGEDGMVEIGYGLYEGFCHRGYMTEAVKTISAWALAQPSVTRVEAETEEDNLASQRVLKRAGFVPMHVRGEEGPRFVYGKNGKEAIR